MYCIRVLALLVLLVGLVQSFSWDIVVAIDENRIVKLSQFCRDIAMDNCGRHIYWITDEGIGRTRLGGSKKEILVNSTAFLRISLAIDQQSQRMYWIDAEGNPTCSCKLGYSGERCEVNACHQYCLNGGVCSLDEASAPVCKCSAEYVGDRCEVSTFAVKCIQTVSMLKNLLNADVTSFTLSKGVKSTCASPVV
ncbi:hypothetical protein PYW08_011058 [Mythimna loreyi]|uniref:Uncharacterized protein n=1 Tax=Mythimna loreyi TaxID=667449 RepID=A0ACC2Q2C4_9NEOP|nr:hypothetical protein PYW08_011058 [Mythimna loreyi]